MRRFSTYLMLAAFAVTMLPLSAQAQLLEDGANMRILKARAKLLHYNKDTLEDDVNNNGDINDFAGRTGCGSVEVGNQLVTAGLGRDIEVIITGDIINTNNRCVNNRATQ